MKEEGLTCRLAGLEAALLFISLYCQRECVMWNIYGILVIAVVSLHVCKVRHTPSFRASVIIYSFCMKCKICIVFTYFSH